MCAMECNWQASQLVTTTAIYILPVRVLPTLAIQHTCHMDINTHYNNKGALILENKNTDQ